MTLAPNGTLETVLFDVKILMAKSSGRNWQERARADGSRGGGPLKIDQRLQVVVWRLEAGRVEARG